MTAPTDAERALEVVRRHAPRYPGYYSILAKDIAAALAAVRAEERERAARIAETWADGQGASAIAKEAEDCPGSAWEHEQAARLVRMLADAIRRQEGRDA